MYYKKSLCIIRKKNISRYKHTFITFFLRYVIPIFTSIGALHSQPSDSIDIRLFRLTIAAVAISLQIVRTNTSKFSSTIIVAKNTKNARVSAPCIIGSSQFFQFSPFSCEYRSHLHGYSYKKIFYLFSFKIQCAYTSYSGL